MNSSTGNVLVNASELSQIYHAMYFVIHAIPHLILLYGCSQIAHCGIIADSSGE